MEDEEKKRQQHMQRKWLRILLIFGILFFVFLFFHSIYSINKDFEQPKETITKIQKIEKIKKIKEDEKTKEMPEFSLKKDKNIEKAEKPEKPVQPKLDPNLFYPNLKDTWIIVITWARVKYMEQTLNSLLSLKGINELNLAISQDGNERMMNELIDRFKNKINSNFKKFDHIHCSTSGKTSQKIAQNYKCGIDKVFHENKAKKVIIVEDDMIFSKDFINYFDKASFLLKDPSVWCISSWNDFGYQQYVSDPKRFFRTQYFPGLGWMISHKRWNEIGPKFADDLWDENMRVDTVSKNRDCIIPEISRNYNIGAEGANMNQHEYDRKLKGIVYYQGEIFDYGSLDYLLKDNYEKMMKNIGNYGTIIKSINEIKSNGKEVFVMPFQGIHKNDLLKELGITFDELRTHHHQTIIIKYKSNTLMLANERISPYLPKDHFKEKNPNLQLIKARIHTSCDDTCKNADKKCAQDHFDYIMSCKTLSEFFPCEKCIVQFGSDMPNFIDETNKCLITQAFIPTCGARHPITKRLCPCI